MTTVTALLTCHDRRAVTLRSLRGWFAQQVPGVRPAAVLVDDGSTDGTADAVRREFPAVRVVAGSGDLYWAGGMALAQRSAGDPDFLLWLNDDVELAGDALATLLATARDRPGAIVAGAVHDGAGRTTYTGHRRVGRRPRGVVPVRPTGRPAEVDSFNGNVVLVPRSAYRPLGPVDARLRHGYADHDYGMRAARLGIPSVLAGRHVGVCRRNGTAGTWQDPAVPRRRRCRLLLGVKGLPPGPHVRFTARHGGPEWPLYVLAGYGRAFGAIALRRPG